MYEKRLDKIEKGEIRSESKTRWINDKEAENITKNTR